VAGLKHANNPWWTIVLPLASVVLIALYFGGLLPKEGVLRIGIEAVLLCGAIFAAVHHAEVVSARVGEPFGSIILAVAVTIIEVGLIVALMLAADDGGPTIARDTVYAAVMLVLTGLIGLCLVLGGHKHFEQKIRVSGTSSYLAVLGTLAAVALILPNFTTSTTGPTYSTAQLATAAAVSLLLYGAFLFIQTVRHRDYFLAAADDSDAANEEFEPPSNRQAAVSLLFLLISLAGVILQAKMLAPALDDVIGAAGLPQEFIGVVIAALVLAPESIAAVRASLANRPQTSINLALGSALASIALTIPVITMLAAFTNVQLALGVPPAKMVLLVLALFVSVITLLPGRTTVLHGVVHLGLFIMFIVVAAVP
jgi:Ca2+:H+ antiporter